MAKNLGRPRTSPSLGSGKSAPRTSPFKGLRTVNPQSNFSSRITTIKFVKPGGSVGGKLTD